MAKLLMAVDISVVLSGFRPRMSKSGERLTFKQRFVSFQFYFALGGGGALHCFAIPPPRRSLVHNRLKILATGRRTTNVPSGGA